MIQPEQALQKILSLLPTPEITVVPLAISVGSVVAEDIYSPIDSPPFHQSAMDGYALSFESCQSNVPIEMVGIIEAGYDGDIEVPAGKSVRIFTGAPLPAGTDTVVMQEHVREENNYIYISDIPQTRYGNVRFPGSQIGAGSLALKKNTRLNPGIIGYLAGLGITEIPVYSAPSIAIITTGKELQPAGEELERGKIYESNAVMLTAAMYEGRLEPSFQFWCTDDSEEIEQALAQALESCQVIIITGGISVGKYDFVREALAKNEVKEIIYKINQKPGKPMYFGVKNNSIVFGLPGNPGAVMNCFYYYIVPALRGMSGMLPIPSNSEFLPIQTGFHKKAGMVSLLKARKTDDGIIIMSGQDSFRLDAFTEADLLAEIPAETTELNPQDKVKVYHLSQVWN